MRKLLVAVLACAAFSCSAFASTPWDGTWKLDLNKSHLTGPSFTYSKTSAGMWHVSDGSAVSYDFAADGKPYKTLTADDTVTATANGDHALTLVSRFKGKVTSTTQETLSPDGKTLTDHTTGTRPDGSTFNDATVYTRVAISWTIPAYKETVRGKADGTPLPITGPTISAGTTVSIKQVSPHRMDYSVKINGKTLGEGYQTLAADGKSFTDTSWAPGLESEKTIGVFVKQ